MGSVLPAAITAASLAFADAGVEMHDMVTSCAAALLSGDKPDSASIVLDPTWEEQSRAVGVLTLMYSSSLVTITHLVQTGVFSPSQLSEAMELCRDGCTRIYEISQAALIAKLKASLEESS